MLPAYTERDSRIMRTLLRTILLVASVMAARGEEAHLTVLATTDMHGNIYPWDYLSGKPSERGLAKIATLVAAQRRTAPDALLLDAGDTIQGTPLESVFQSGQAGPGLTVDPMMQAMNYLRYDAMTVGNHEFNYGLEKLTKARSQAKFPWLSANTNSAPGTIEPFQPWLIRQVKGVTIAVIGLTTPAIPSWEKPENYKGVTWTDPVRTAQDAVVKLRSSHHADVVIALVHAGLEAEDSQENCVRRLANSVPGLDVIIFGHTHQSLPESRINGVLITQPKNWAMSLARIDLNLQRDPGRAWKVTSASSRDVKVTADIKADQEVLRLTEPYHKATESWLSTVVSQSKAALNGSRSRIEDTAIVDAIHQVQMYYTKADVSFAASFNYSAHISAGPVTRRDIASLYVYDNELYAIEGTGRIVREALENAARFYRSCANAECTGGLINPKFLGFNYDMAQGVSYDIDLTRPAGQRIRNLRFRGKPLEDNQKLRIAVNNYRAAGSAGYTMFRGAPVVWQSYETIRDLMIEYYATHPIPTMPDNNWRIEPAVARTELVREGARFAGTLATQ